MKKFLAILLMITMLLGIAMMTGCNKKNAVLASDFVIPEDVKRQVIPVLGHRLSAASRRDGEQYLTDLLGRVRVPTESL